MATTACLLASYGGANPVQTGDRGGVDDVAAAGHDQMRQERADAVDDAPEVDAHGPLPGLDPSEPGSPAAPTPALLNSTCTATNRSTVAGARASTCRLADVGATVIISTPWAPPSAAAAANASSALGQHDVQPALAKRWRGEPDPAPCSGDDRYLASTGSMWFPLLSTARPTVAPSELCERPGWGGLWPRARQQKR